MTDATLRYATLLCRYMTLTLPWQAVYSSTQIKDLQSPISQSQGSRLQAPSLGLGGGEMTVLVCSVFRPVMLERADVGDSAEAVCDRSAPITTTRRPQALMATMAAILSEARPGRIRPDQTGQDWTRTQDLHRGVGSQSRKGKTGE